MDEVRKPSWRCEECGHEDRQKPMPKDRDSFYKKMHDGQVPKWGY